MPRTPNPLEDMKNVQGYVDLDQDRPDEAFARAVLSGFQKVVRARRAIRIFDGTPIPEDVMRDCLGDAILSPSASNLQTYELYWLRDDAKKQAMAEYCLGQPAAETAGEIVVVVSRVDLWQRNLDKMMRIMTKDGKKPLEGPFADYYTRIVPMLMRTDALGVNNLIRRVVLWFRGLQGPTVRGPISRGDHRVYGHIQASLAAQTLMLSLAAHGYESCPMTGIDRKAIARMLGIPASAEVQMVIAAGQGKPEGLFSPRARLPFSDLVKEV